MGVSIGSVWTSLVVLSKVGYYSERVINLNSDGQKMNESGTFVRTKFIIFPWRFEPATP